MSNPSQHPEWHAKANEPVDKAERFVGLSARHEKRLFAYILSLVMDWSIAQDLYQETNMRLWRQFDRYEEGTDFGAWACTIAYYQVLTYREKCGREKLRFSPEFLASLADSVAKSDVEGSGQEARLRMLAECRSKLNPAANQLLRLVYGDGLQVREAAERLGKKPGMVYKSLSRIRSALHRCIERRLRQEGAR